MNNAVNNRAASSASANSFAVARASLADAVYETLVEAIVRGQLAPGADVSAVLLAEQFQVSRTPVTEALRRLEHDGLVQQKLNHRPQVVSLSRADAIEVYHMRKHLEGAAAEQAATRLSEDALRALAIEMRRLERSRKSLDWSAAAIDFDLRFHDALAEAAGNSRLREDIARYRRLVRCFCRLTGDATNLRSAMREHALILTALEQRKPAAARRAMIAHIDRRLAAVLAELYA